MNQDLLSIIYRYQHEMYMCSIRKELLQYYKKLWDYRWNDSRCYNRALIHMGLLTSTNPWLLVCSCCHEKYNQPL